jgi:type VI secretion system secreted protein VgrG
MVLLGTLTLMLIVPTSALAGATIPDLGTAGSFGVLAGSAVTNTGPTTVDGDVGVSPGTSVTGFPPGIATGTIHAGNAVAAQAQNDAATAYNNAAGQACDFDLTGQDLGGMTLIPGVYCFDSSAQLTGQLTLDGQGGRNSVFIFQIGSTLTTASNASVEVINSAEPCNVFWQVGSSATLGTNTDFAGNILALTSITLNTGAATQSGLYALNGAVTLDTNDIHACGFVQGPTSTPTAVSTDTAVATSTVPATATALPPTNTSIPVATNTPASTSTVAAINTATAVPSTATSIPGATNTPIPSATIVPTQTPGVINTPIPTSTSTRTPANTVVPNDTVVPNNTPVPDDTVVPNDTATATALATNTVAPPTTAIATDTAISTPSGTVTGTATETATATSTSTTSTSATPTTAIAIGTTTVTATVESTPTQTPTIAMPGDTPVTTLTTTAPTPAPYLPPTGGGHYWGGPFALVVGMFLLIGTTIRLLFRKVGPKVGRDEVQ